MKYLDERFPCPHCETTDFLSVKRTEETFAVVCKCGICTVPKASLKEACEVWDFGAEIADILEWESYAPHEFVEEFLSHPFGSEGF